MADKTGLDGQARDKNGSAGLLCPSSQPQLGARILGMVRKTPEGARIGYFNEPIPATAEHLARSAPALPTEVFRLAAPCAEHKCSHFTGSQCKLGSRIAQRLDPVVAGLPACGIRAICRWFREHGKRACTRCPQVVTDHRELTEAQRELAGIEPIRL